MFQDEQKFVISAQPEEGKDKCPYGPTTGYTALIIGKPFSSWQFIPEFGRGSELTPLNFRPADVFSLPVWIQKFSRYSP